MCHTQDKQKHNKLYSLNAATLTAGIQEVAIKVVSEERVRKTTKELFQAASDIMNCVVLWVNVDSSGILVESLFKAAYCSFFSTLAIKTLSI